MQWLVWASPSSYYEPPARALSNYSSGFLLLKDPARLGPIRMMVPKMATIVPA